MNQHMLPVAIVLVVIATGTIVWRRELTRMHLRLGRREGRSAAVRSEWAFVTAGVLYVLAAVAVFAPVFG